MLNELAWVVNGGKGDGRVEFLHGYVLLLQVLEKFQRQGLGRKLRVHALDKLKALGTQEVFLATAETNDVARNLYESLGFNQFRKQIHYSLRIDSSSTDDT